MSEPVRVRRFERLDFAAALAKPEQTREGFWRVEGRVARTGIQHYHDAAGGTRAEFRSDEEVKKSLPGFLLSPLTNAHPPALVTADTARQYVSGAVGAAELHADGWVTAPIIVYDKAAIAAMKAGRAQLSVGYTATVIDEPGEWNGERYDSRQVDITVNHVALVDAARAGPDARLRLDAGDAATPGLACDTQPALASDQGVNAMANVIKVDGFQFEVNDPNAQACIDRAVAAARKDGDDKATAEKVRADNADKLRGELQKSLSELQAKHDALEAQAKAHADKMVKCGECEGEGKVDGAKCDNCEGEGEYESKADTAEKRKDSLNRIVSRLVNARATLLTEARRHLGANEKLDGKSDIEIKKLVITKLDKDAKLDGKDDAYVNMRYQVQIDCAKVSPIAEARAAVTSQVADAHADEKPSDPEQARLAMLDRRRKAYVK